MSFSLLTVQTNIGIPLRAAALSVRLLETARRLRRGRHLNRKAATTKATGETEFCKSDETHQFGTRVSGGEIRLQAAHQLCHLGFDGEQLNADTFDSLEASERGDNLPNQSIAANLQFQHQKLLRQCCKHLLERRHGDAPSSEWEGFATVERE